MFNTIQDVNKTRNTVADKELISNNYNSIISDIIVKNENSDAEKILDIQKKLKEMSESVNSKYQYEFTPVSIDLLNSVEFDNKKNNRKLVSFESSFDRFNYTIDYGVNTYGYRLCDKNGNCIRVENIYTKEISGLPKDRSRDFNKEALEALLKFGNNVKIEGAYIPSYIRTSHNVPFKVPPQIDVYFINGEPVSKFVSK